jgi:hypothetical protein
MTDDPISFEDLETLRVRDGWNALMRMFEVGSKIDESVLRRITNDLGLLHKGFSVHTLS